MLKTIIVDDDPVSCTVLEQLLSDHFVDVALEGSARTASTGIQLIKKAQPDLVFLDVELDGSSGFDIIRSTRRIPYEVVIYSQHDSYALEAYRINAIDYLVKPANISDLYNALRKVRERQQLNSLLAKVDDLTDELREVTHGQFERIKITTSNGFQLVELRHIIRCEADRNYTKIVLTTGLSLLTPQTLKSFEDKLSQSDFCRIHKSHLVNLRHVSAYHRTDAGGGAVLMTNGDELQVAKRKKELLLRSLPQNGRKY